MRAFFLILLLLFVCHVSVTGQADTLLQADFSAGTLPPGWSRSQAPGSSGWQVGDSASLSGSFWRIPARGRFAASNDDVCGCDMSEDILILPPVDTRGLPALFLTFSTYFDGIFGSQGHVLARTRADGPWQEVFALPPTGTWSTHTLNLDAWRGHAQLQLAFRHDDGGGWGTGVAIDDVQLTVPPARDLALSIVPPPAYLRPGFLSFEMTVTNRGTEPVSSYQLAWQVEGEAPQMVHQGQERIAPLASQTRTHPLPWAATQPGTHQLRLWVAQPNGQADLIPANDTVSFTVTVVAGAPDRPVLVEAFTQHNCQTCAQQNPGLHDALYNHRDQVAPVIYHASWPLGNNDPMHLFNPLAHSGRINFYQIGGVPYGLLEGRPITGGSYEGAVDGLNGEAIDGQVRQPGLYALDLHRSPGNGVVNVSVGVTALLDPPGTDPRLYVAVVQEEVLFAQPSGLNGETVFPHVLRYLLPNADGISLASLPPGQSQTFSLAWAPAPELLSATHHLVAWVQDAQTRRVWGVARSAGTRLCPDGSPLILDVQTSPAACDGSSLGGATLSLQGGQPPYQASWPDGQQALSRSDLAAGWYPVQIQDAGGCSFATEVRVAAPAGPEVYPVVHPVSCPGGQDGAIAIRRLGGETFTYAWDHGPQQDSLSGLSAGAYSVTVSDPDGCATTFSVDLPEPAPLQPEYRRQPDDGSGTGSVSVLPVGGTAPYSILWDDGSTEPTRTGLSEGPFTFSVSDFYGCSYGPFTEYIWTTDLNEPPVRGEWQLFPVPARDRVQLRWEGTRPEALTYSLFDARGRRLRQGQRPPQAVHVWEISLAGLAAGTYWLQLKGAHWQEGRRLVVVP
ncbi:MAG: hypothetical protein D6722_08105 [Bacteroidetes bacterium]|nr:MAG: hypothetical protein D6722_08105 [Bacteroidota bacterium]